MYHVSWGNLRYLLTCKALVATRVTTPKWFLSGTCVDFLFVRPSVGRGLRHDAVSCILVGRLAIFAYLWVLRWDESYDSKIFLVKDLCCLINGKTFGGPRVKTRYCIMYLGGGNLHYLITCKALDETRVTTPKCFLWRACAVCLMVRPSVGRG